VSPISNRHIHFIGIGGIGVSGIAQLAMKRGDRVSGSDIKESAITRKLSRMGARICIGHDPKNLRRPDLVVYSSAIRPDNPEIVAAGAQGIPVIRRAEFLSELMADKKVITVTGAHGKTTTSSLAAKLLMSAGLHPTVAVGGILREDGDNVKSGDSLYFVSEADESDGTFLMYKPTYSIITNIDYEHMDFYKTYDNLLKSFATFVRQTKEGGCIFYFQEDQALESIVKESKVRSVSFGFSPQADYYPRSISLEQCRLTFTVFRHRQELGEISLGLMGRHNVANALAVIALGLELKIDFEKIRSAFKGFKGVERRFQVKYEGKDVFVVDDYAHHPTEIAATIAAAKVCPRRRLVVVFQPHRYSRTQLLLEQFAQSFIKSDYLVITDIYAAGEKPIAGVSPESIIDRIRRQTQIPAEYVAKDHVVAHLKNLVREDDLVLFLGAGDITKLSDEFAESFQK
jgi:UDP-N-acetylmuramate--alanine ligase